MSNRDLPICLRCQKEQTDKHLCYICFRDLARNRATYEYVNSFQGLPDYKGDHCSYELTGRAFYNQPFYECPQCFPADPASSCVCWFCANECREKGHHLQVMYGPGFCDKGDNIQRQKDLLEHQHKEAEKRRQRELKRDARQEKCIIL